MEMGGDDAESEPGQHEADMALADASVETASGTVHVATAVPVRGAGLQVQPPMAITQSKATGYARSPAARSSRSPEAPSCRGVVVLSCDVERREWRSSGYSHFACFLPARRESSAFFSLLLSLSHTSDLAGSSSLIILALRLPAYSKAPFG
jgi:hypothetical protein